MLLEQLVEKAKEVPEYDWESYYAWRFSEVAGREVTDYSFWLCKRCLTTNLLLLPVRYGKCRCCDLIHLPNS
ncbi:hypothetical protein [Geomonas propionica]|uniref:Uncharacterized protein n=1 Tax=Geomonas propionica TaxID=2798582 RepID=A0ABS0YLN7_9BACT|nr:hypothetical protein [Geomonas propionica]MBJ6798803.1 hypothetical protein [Geomonas propionica]